MPLRDRTVHVVLDDSGRRVNVVSTRDKPPHPPHPPHPHARVSSSLESGYEASSVAFAISGKFILVDSAEFDVEWDPVALSQIHILSVDSFEEGHENTAPNDLDVDFSSDPINSEFGWEDESPALTSVHNLAVQGSEYGFEIFSTLLDQNGNITVVSFEQGFENTAPNDVVHTVHLSPVEMDFGWEGDSPDLDQIHTLLVQGSEFGYEALSIPIITLNTNIDSHSAESGYEAQSIFFLQYPLRITNYEIGYEARSVLIAPPVIPPGTFIVGLNPQVHSGGFTTGPKKAFCIELGVHSLRLAFNHGNYDEAVRWSADRNIDVCFMLGYGVGCNLTTTAGRQCYADRSAGLVRTYGNMVQYWEVHNEWNGAFGPYGDFPENSQRWVEYVDLLRRTYIAIKNENANAVVVGGVLGGANRDFLINMLNVGGGDWMDVLSLHHYPYRNPQPQSVPPGAPASQAVDLEIAIMNDRRNLCVSIAGRTIPILITETGFHGADTTALLELERQYLTQLFDRMPVECPFVDGIWWYELQDAQGDTFGMVTGAGVRKPVFNAFKLAAQL